MERPSVSELINSKKFIIPFIASWFLFTIICICIIFGGIYGLLTFLEGIPSDYQKASGWKCDQATFETEYLEMYVEKIEELEKKYDLNFERNIEIKDNRILEIRLSAEEYIIFLKMENYKNMGCLYAKLQLYLKDEQEIDNLDLESHLKFLNDFVHFAGYDTKPDKNNFEYLYKELIKNGSERESYIYNSIESLFDVGYWVGISNREAREDYERYYWFLFKGLLKPLT